MSLILPLAYLPPVSYFSALASGKEVVLESAEHFIKQTIRNRCRIAGANGTLLLTVPVEHDNRWRKPIRDLRVSTSGDWNRLHWRSIVSSYGKSTYFMFYEEPLRQALLKKHTFLWDLNTELLNLLAGWIRVPAPIGNTDEFMPNYEEGKDFRNYWDTENKYTTEPKAYYQVFSDRHGFQRDLSAIDLLFNTGPEARSFI
jgi:hypothetical protein